MSPFEFSRDCVTPGLDLLRTLGGPAPTDEANVLLTAIAGQESNWNAQRQAGNGPARGKFQFEKNGGVAAVLEHRATKALARAVCEHFGVAPTRAALHAALAGTEDRLDVCCARLLLLTDPHPLPSAQEAGWACYLRTWRPGKPHPASWPRCWEAAGAAVAAQKKKFGAAVSTQRSEFDLSALLAEQAGDSKPWWQSRAVVGALVVVVSVLARSVGVEVDSGALTDSAMAAIDIGTQATALVGAALALWGRVRATRPVHFRRPRPAVPAPDLGAAGLPEPLPPIPERRGAAGSAGNSYWRQGGGGRFDPD